MVDSIISLTIEKFGELLIHEAVFLHGVSEQVEELQTEFKRMRCFLKEADSKVQEGDERVRNWVNEVRDVAYDAEDAIDKFIIKVAFKRKGGIQGLLQRFAYIFNRSKYLHMVGKEIESIQNRIRNISQSRETYGIKNIGEGEGTSSTYERMQQLRRTYLHVEDEDIIGLEEDIETLVAELIKEEERVHVISITGMGGLGKTTLAKKVFKHKDVKLHFECFAWTFVSQQCKRRDVLQEMVKKVGAPTAQEMEKMNEEDLVMTLHNFLKEKRYLFVLDDIWNNEDWESLEHAFPTNGEKGSKIMLTTRNNDVASHWGARRFIHKPNYLTEDQGWELLRKKAFSRNASTSWTPNLEVTGRQMVTKCGGLPLAVAVLGGLLAKKLPNEWEDLQSRTPSCLRREGEYRVEGLLALSYNELPSHLKPCFLYLGMYPEDFEIPTEKLITLWVAEGFIPQEREVTLEEKGEEYLAELTTRCMVQTGRRSKTGRIKMIHIHDLMRDLCLLKGREQNFLDIFDGNSTVPLVNSNRLRRQAIHSGFESYATLENPSSHLRTLLSFQNYESLRIPSTVEFIYRDLKLLRVLDLYNVKLRNRRLARKIERLVHLRYLGLHRAFVNKIPKAIGNLQSLQTLDLRIWSPDDKKIPNVIWKLKKLRHLYMRGYRISCHLRLDTLINLQTLWVIDAGSWIEEGLGNLSNLRKLGIQRLSRSQVEVVLDSIIVRSIRSLFLELDYDEESFPDLDPISHCHHLLKLRLSGRIDNIVRKWPPNLNKLILFGSRLQQNSLSTLQNLPNLIFFTLGWNAYEGKEMIFNAKGFPQLQFLRIHDLFETKEWIVEEGAMPYLKHLEIIGCENLRMVPEGLRFIVTLQELEIYYTSREFEERVEREFGNLFLTIKSRWR